MPLKVRVTPPEEGGGRVMSATDASTAQSTPPKTGTDAQMQRMNNTIKSFVKSGLSTGVIGKMYQKALKANAGGGGRSVSDKDVKTAEKATKKDPKNYEGKAYGGKTKKMAMGGKTYSNGVRKPAAMGGKARKK